MPFAFVLTTTDDTQPGQRPRAFGHDGAATLGPIWCREIVLSMMAVNGRHFARSDTSYGRSSVREPRSKTHTEYLSATEII